MIMHVEHDWLHYSGRPGGHRGDPLRVSNCNESEKRRGKEWLGSGGGLAAQISPGS